MFQTKPGPSKEITDKFKEDQQWEYATGDAVLTNKGNHSLIVDFYESGITLNAKMFTEGGELSIEYCVYVPRNSSGGTRGLLGNLDSNEFYSKGGTTPLPNTYTDQELNPHLLTCKMISIDNKHITVDSG